MPVHYDGPHIWTGDHPGGRRRNDDQGLRDGQQLAGLLHHLAGQEAFARGFHVRPDDVSETVKLVLLLGEYMHRQLSRPLSRQGAEPALCSCATRMTRCCATTIS